MSTSISEVSSLLATRTDTYVPARMYDLCRDLLHHWITPDEFHAEALRLCALLEATR